MTKSNDPGSPSKTVTDTQRQSQGNENTPFKKEPIHDEQLDFEELSSKQMMSIMMMKMFNSTMLQFADMHREMLMAKTNRCTSQIK